MRNLHNNRVNVFKPGSGTIKIWENVGGTRGEQKRSFFGTIYMVDKNDLFTKTGSGQT